MLYFNEIQILLQFFCIKIGVFILFNYNEHVPASATVLRAVAVDTPTLQLPKPEEIAIAFHFEKKLHFRHPCKGRDPFFGTFGISFSIFNNDFLRQNNSETEWERVGSIEHKQTVHY